MTGVAHKHWACCGCDLRIFLKQPKDLAGLYHSDFTSFAVPVTLWCCASLRPITDELWVTEPAGHDADEICVHAAPNARFLRTRNGETLEVISFKENPGSRSGVMRVRRSVTAVCAMAIDEGSALLPVPSDHVREWVPEA